METVHEFGVWALEKKEDGLYVISCRGEERAEIVTHRHEPEDPLEEYDPWTTTYQVRDLEEARNVFMNYVEKETGYVG